MTIYDRVSIDWLTFTTHLQHKLVLPNLNTEFEIYTVWRSLIFDQNHANFDHYNLHKVANPELWRYQEDAMIPRRCLKGEIIITI